MNKRRRRGQFTQTDTLGRYVVRVSKATIPGSWGWRGYYCIAIIETDGRKNISMIADRGRGVRKIRRKVDRVYIGKTMRSKGLRILTHYHKVVRRANRIAARKLM